MIQPLSQEYPMVLSDPIPNNSCMDKKYGVQNHHFYNSRKQFLWQELGKKVCLAFLCSSSRFTGQFSLKNNATFFLAFHTVHSKSCYTSCKAHSDMCAILNLLNASFMLQSVWMIKPIFVEKTIKAQMQSQKVQYSKIIHWKKMFQAITIAYVF